MVGRAIWKGYIHFSSVFVPVRLYIAIKEERIRFHLLHRKDHVRLEQRMVCAYEKVPVPKEEQTRGFELEDGKYILIDPVELEPKEPENSRLIEVLEFVRSEEIDPLFLERVYYLESDTPSQGYVNLVRTLETMDMQGICTWTMRKRTYLGALQVKGSILRLNTLRYADEVIPAKSLDLENMPVSEKELMIGSDLINHLTGPFEPNKFENEHERKLQNLIDKKARGERVTILRPRRLKPTGSDRLLAVLEESLKRVV
jgi:DNA end-binding protein Ku